MSMANNILHRAQAGDTAAIQALVQTYQQEVFRLALSILDDPGEAEEATQDVFISALNALDKYRGEATFKTWLFSITINVCRRWWRKRQNRERLNQALQSIFRLAGVGPTHPEEILIRREAKAELWEAVAGLGEKHRLPLILFYEHELPVAEIAKVLELPVGIGQKRSRCDAVFRLLAAGAHGSAQELLRLR